LGILDEMLMLGGDRILQTVFYSENGRNVSVPSEWFNGNRQGALGLSRAEMDFRLMEKAKELGVEVLEECSVIGLLFENEKVCGVKIKNFEGETEEILSDLTIDATGRAKVLAKLSEKEISRKDAKTQRKIRENLRPKTKVQRQKLVGFKAHLKNVHLEKGRCEIYFFRGGYGGLNYVENGVANHCFLMKAEIIKEFKSDVEAILQNVIFQNTRAKETLKEAENLYDWLAVSVDGFGIKEINPAKNLLTVGDAAAFIDPFTGSGMLMAFESAKILAVVIAENQYSAEKIVEQYELLHKAKFQRRMQVCKIMRQLSFIPSFAKSAISVLSLSKRFRETLVRLTRKAGTEKGI
jgi:flavin-dependent dehydrogenase